MSRMVPAPDALVGKRFDVAVAKMLGISRSKAADLVDSGQARVLGREVARSSTLQAGETVEFDLAEEQAEPEPIATDMAVVYEDDDVVVEHIHEDAKTEEKENEDGTKETIEVSPAKDLVKINKRPVSLSDTHPLWNKRPNECTDEEYKNFYHKVFHDFKEPLFWIHLNMDYPFNLKGILYFPQINTEYDLSKEQLNYNNNQGIYRR